MAAGPWSRCIPRPAISASSEPAGKRKVSAREAPNKNLRSHTMRRRAVTIIALFPLLLGLSYADQNSSVEKPGGETWVFSSEDSGTSSYLGVDIADITTERLSALKLKEEKGVEVTMVDQDAPAGKAGLKEHDVILTVNDQKVESVEQLRRLIRELPSGRTITVGISRDGQPMNIKATLAERNKLMGNNHDFNFTMPQVNIPAINIPAINIPQIGPIVVYTSP